MKIADLNKEEFIAGIQSGLGLTASCRLINITPKYMSAYLRSDNEFMASCNEIAIYSAKAMLILSQQYLEKKQFDKWKKNNEAIRAYISTLNLWESFLKKDEIKKDPETYTKIVECFTEYVVIDEVATVLGMTKVELNHYLFSNPKLRFYLKDSKML